MARYLYTVMSVGQRCDDKNGFSVLPFEPGLESEFPMSLPNDDDDVDVFDVDSGISEGEANESMDAIIDDLIEQISDLNIELYDETDASLCDAYRRRIAALQAQLDAISE